MTFKQISDVIILTPRDHVTCMDTDHCMVTQCQSIRLMETLNMQHNTYPYFFNKNIICVRFSDVIRQSFG